MGFKLEDLKDQTEVSWSWIVDLDGDLVVSANNVSLFMVEEETGRLDMWPVTEHDRSKLQSLTFVEKLNDYFLEVVYDE